MVVKREENVQNLLLEVVFEVKELHFYVDLIEKPDLRDGQNFRQIVDVFVNVVFKFFNIKRLLVHARVLKTVYLNDYQIFYGSLDLNVLYFIKLC